LAAFGSLGAKVRDVLRGAAFRASVPDRINKQDIRYIEQTTELFEHWDLIFGGGLSRSAVIGQLEWTRQVHQRSSFTPQTRRDFQAAIGRLSEVAGFMSFDDGDHNIARRCWLLGLQMASEAGDWPLRVNILLDMARQALYLDRPKDALDFMRIARAADDRVTPTVRTMLYVVTARAHARKTNIDEVRQLIGMAENEFARRTPEDDPAWIWYYDEAELHGGIGHALYDLALKGTLVDHACRRLEAAATMHGPAMARSRTFDWAKLATLRMLHGDPVEALESAERALTGAVSLRSRRVADHLKDLWRACDKHKKDPEVANLRRRIRTVLRAVA
jgi:hypothetical protein